MVSVLTNKHFFFKDLRLSYKPSLIVILLLRNANLGLHSKNLRTWAAA